MYETQLNNAKDINDNNKVRIGVNTIFDIMMSFNSIMSDQEEKIRTIDVIILQCISKSSQSLSKKEIYNKLGINGSHMEHYIKECYDIGWILKKIKKTNKNEKEIVLKLTETGKIVLDNSKSKFNDWINSSSDYSTFSGILNFNRVYNCILKLANYCKNTYSFFSFLDAYYLWGLENKKSSVLFSRINFSELFNLSINCAEEALKDYCKYRLLSQIGTEGKKSFRYQITRKAIEQIHKISSLKVDIQLGDDRKKSPEPIMKKGRSNLRVAGPIELSNLSSESIKKLKRNGITSLEKFIQTSLNSLHNFNGLKQEKTFEEVERAYTMLSDLDNTLIEQKADEIPLQSLNLSKKTIAELNNVSINTLRDLYAVSVEDYGNLNLHHRSIDTIKSQLAVIQPESYSDEKKVYLSDSILCKSYGCSRISKSIVLFKNNDYYVKDIKLENMKLSKRAHALLESLRIKTLSQLCEYPYSEIGSQINAGGKTLKEICTYVKDHTLLDHSFLFINHLVDFEMLCNLFYLDKVTDRAYGERIKKNISRIMHNREVSEILRNRSSSNDYYKTIPLIVNDEGFFNLILDFLYEIFEEYLYITLEDFETIIPNQLTFRWDSQALVNYLLKRNVIKQYYHGFIFVRPKFIDYLKSLDNNIEKECLIQRLEGEKWSAIATVTGQNESNVKKYVKQLLSKCPTLEEDMYLEFYQKYELSERMLELFFELDEDANLYYKLRQLKCGDENYKGLLSEDLPDEIKAKVMRYENPIIVENKQILRYPIEIICYLLQKDQPEEISIQNIHDSYKLFLQNNNLMQEQYLTSALNKLNEILSKYRDFVKCDYSTFRYCPIDENKIKKIVSATHFDSYKDVEVSTVLFMRKYPKKMKIYGIRSEDELYHLLKWRYRFRNEYRFEKAPIICIGDVDRKRQIVELISELGPVKQKTLIESYDKHYGISLKNTFNFELIKKQYYSGLYHPVLSLNGAERKLLKQLLKGDFLHIKDILEAMRKQFPRFKEGKINPTNLQDFGYNIEQSIIYHDIHKNLTDYFKEKYLLSDIIDLSSVKWIINAHKGIKGLIVSLEQSFEIIEFNVDKYISINRFEENGYSKEDLIDFCRKACDFIEQDIFTIRSLKKLGFESDVFNLGFDTTFYESLIKNYLPGRWQTVGKTILFQTEKKPTLSDLIRSIIVKNGSMDIYDLLDYLRDEYGVVTNINNLKNRIQNSDLYYENTMEKVYLDIEQFYEEID